LTEKSKLYVLALFKLTGLPFTFGGRQVPGDPEDKEWFEQFCGKLSELVLTRKIRRNPVKFMGGLDSVSEGFKYMEEGRVHGEKLIFEVVRE